MEFEPSDELKALQDSLARWLAQHYTFATRRELMAGGAGHSEEAWATYAGMGLLALPLPADDGGLGGAWSDFCALAGTLGTAMVLEPVLPTLVAADALGAAGSAPQRSRWLPAVAEGRAKLAWAHGEPGARFARTKVATRAVREGAGWRLDGTKNVVVGAPQADALVVSARVSGADDAADGLALFVVDRKDVRLKSYVQHDGRRAAEVQLAGVAVGADALLGDPGAAVRVIEQALDRGAAAACSEAVGVMQAINAATLDYLKTRKQFGVTIGSFQALQHRMADMVVAEEQARAMALLAAVRCDAAPAAERSRTVAAAKAYVGQQARFVGQEAIQLHGGMGITDELAVSHLFKRLTLLTMAFGDTDHHFARFSASLLAAPVQSPA